MKNNATPEFLLHVRFGGSTRWNRERGRRGFWGGWSARQGSPELARILAGDGGGGKGMEKALRWEVICRARFRAGQMGGFRAARGFRLLGGDISPIPKHLLREAKFCAG
jgi:hypothetical protein